MTPEGDGKTAPEDAGGQVTDDRALGPPRTMAERVDAALTVPPQTLLGGVEAPPPKAPDTAMLASTGDARATATAPALEGRVIKGRYVIRRLLGEGGMGGVYEAEHLEIGRRVAIKIVSTRHARDPHIAARIKLEARSTGAIESEHIVQVFDAGEDEDVGLFLVMELLKGEDLAALLAQEKSLPPVRAVTFAAQAAQGLARAHAARIVHRDLKPANIFVCQRDDGSSFVKLVDFGIAKLLRDATEKGAGPLTRMGMVIGTPQYMSPEQAQGLPTVDHRTDIYSLGAVLFETLSGRPPFLEMPTYEQTILQIMMKPAPRLTSVMPDAPPSLDALLAEMMAHDPLARPQLMVEVRDRLLRVLAQLGAPSAGDISGNHAVETRDRASAWRGSASDVGNPSRPSVEEAARATPPATSTGVAIDPPPANSEPVASIAGLPRRRGRFFAPFLVTGAVLGLAGFVLLRGSDPATEDASTASPRAAALGLVQAGVHPPATPPVVSAIAASATPSVSAPAPSSSAATPPPSAAPPHPWLPPAMVASSPPKTTVPRPKGNAAPAKPATHLVGATDIADEF
jgi:serine/threonine-protein kinase